MDEIALWGALTGTLALGLRVAEYVRDRPKLSLRLRASAFEDKPAWIGLEVANNGRRPTTLVEAGFVLAITIEIRNLSKPDAPTVKTQPRTPFTSRTDEPKIVAPGAVAVYRSDLTSWPQMVAADVPIRG